MTHEVTTWHLEMTSPDDLRPKMLHEDVLTVTLCSPPSGQLNHALFMEIGTPYRWFSRLSWTRDDWDAHARDPAVRTWLGSLHGTPFGYAEIQHHAEKSSTEIMFFGVCSAFTGRGLGAHLLSVAVQRAWEMPGTCAVTVHTCSSDGPAALPNYKARGFRIERTVTELETIPEPDDPVWSSPAYYRSLHPE